MYGIEMQTSCNGDCTFCHDQVGLGVVTQTRLIPLKKGDNRWNKIDGSCITLG